MKFSNYLVLCRSHCDNHKQITKTCYFNACLEYIFCFKTFMQETGIKILGSTSVLMILFSIWQSAITSFDCTLYIQFLLFFGNLKNSAWAPLVPPLLSRVKYQQAVSSAPSLSFSFLKCCWSHVLRKRINLPSIPILWVPNTHWERTKSRTRERNFPSFPIKVLNSDIPVSSGRKNWTCCAEQCIHSAPNPFSL